MIPKEIACLIQASFHPDGDERIRKWNQWRRLHHDHIHDFSQLQFSPNEIRLIPLAWYGLQEQLPVDSFYKLCQGLYKKNHFLNIRRFSNAARFMHLLEENHVSYACMKGLPLLLMVYPGMGCRVMGDVDILVPFSAKKRVFDLLGKHDWNCEVIFPDIWSLYQFHSISWNNPATGMGVDIHWKAVNWFYDEGLDHFLLQSSSKVHYKSFSINALKANHLCFHIIANHLFTTNTHWIADVLLMERQYNIDLEEFIKLSHRMKLTYPIAECLKSMEAFTPLFKNVVHELAQISYRPFHCFYYHYAKNQKEENVILKLLARYVNYYSPSNPTLYLTVILKTFKIYFLVPWREKVNLLFQLPKNIQQGLKLLLYLLIGKKDGNKQIPSGLSGL